MTHTDTPITVGGTTDESQWEIISCVSDLYKELNGYRAKFDWSNSTTKEIEEYYDELILQAEREQAQEQE